jgi:hypothetical protein
VDSSCAAERGAIAELDPGDYYDDFEPDEDYLAALLEAETARHHDLAREQLGRLVTGSEPAAVRSIAEDLLVASGVGIEGEPDVEYEDGEVVFTNGSLREVILLCPARALKLARAIVFGTVGHLRVLARLLRRRPHARTVRVARRRSAVRASPGDDGRPPRPSGLALALSVARRAS